MRKHTFIFLLCFTTSAFGQFFAPHQKPMLGLQLNRAHQLGDPVAFYLLNEGSGNKIFDLSGNGNAGTITGATWQSTQKGSALNFGVRENLYYVTVADKPNLNPSFITVEALLRTPDTWQDDNSRPIIHKAYTSHDAPYYQYTLHSGYEGGSGRYHSLYLSIDDSLEAVVSTVGSCVSGTWYYLIGTYDGTTMKLYVNGVQDGSNSVSGTIDSYATPLYFGRYGNLTGNAYNGVGHLAFVRIYNRALSASEIALLYREPFCMVGPSWNYMLYSAITVTPSGQVIFINP